MMEALHIWWHAVEWLWGWSLCVIIPVIVYKGLR